MRPAEITDTDHRAIRKALCLECRQFAHDLANLGLLERYALDNTIQIGGAS